MKEAVINIQSLLLEKRECCSYDEALPPKHEALSPSTHTQNLNLNLSPLSPAAQGETPQKPISKTLTSPRKPKAFRLRPPNPHLHSKTKPQTRILNPKPLNPEALHSPTKYNFRRFSSRLSKRVRQVRLLPGTDQTCKGLCCLIEFYLAIYLSLSLSL